MLKLYSKWCVGKLKRIDGAHKIAELSSDFLILYGLVYVPMRPNEIRMVNVKPIYAKS